MSNIQKQCVLVHLDSGLNASSALQFTSNDSPFTNNAISVITGDEEVDLGDINTPHDVFIKLISGDDLKIGFDGATYPMRLSGAGDFTLLRLDVEGRIEKSTVTTVADTGGSLSGLYFDLTDRVGTVRVWFNVDIEANASGTITYGAPVAATAASGTITFGAPTNGDTLVFDGTTFTKVAAGPGADEFVTIADLTALIDAAFGVSATEDATTITVVADTVGVAGNSFTVSKTGAALTLSAATLTGGLDGDTVVVDGTTFTCVSAAPAADEFSSVAELELLVEALTGINASETAGVVTVSSAAAGASGNDITLALGTGNAGTMAISGATLTGGLVPATPPTNPGRLIEAAFEPNDTADAVATAIATAVGADSSFNASELANVVTIQDTDTGTRADVVAGTSTMAVAKTQDGAASPVVHMLSTGTSQVVVAVAPN